MKHRIIETFGRTFVSAGVLTFLITAEIFLNSNFDLIILGIIFLILTAWSGIPFFDGYKGGVIKK